MQARSATTAAVAVAILGLIGYLVFDGVASGLALFVAGLVLVAVGVWGWQSNEAPAAALATGMNPPAEALADLERPRSDPNHDHQRPIVGHSELLGHIRRSHVAIPRTGTTVQLRERHERAHGRSE